ncbi:MAG: hypothetical protein M1823_005494 [Watsoniomyces obsoletus]|nr:MAG: hypothetical protein M1823_005494 [Watsoniomyces obsoletus]
MSLIKPPTFHGTRGEDVEDFIEMCRLAYSPQDRYYASVEDKEAAKRAILISNLAGGALEFYQLLPKTDRYSWTALTRKLREKYTAPASTASRDQATRDYATLSQGLRTNREYVRHARNIKDVLGEEWDKALAEAFVRGIRNETLRMIISSQCESGVVSFEEVARKFVSVPDDHDAKIVKEKNANVPEMDKKEEAILKYIAQINRDVMENTNKREEKLEERDRKMIQALTDSLNKLSLNSGGTQGAQGRYQQVQPASKYPPVQQPPRNNGTQQARPVPFYIMCYTCGERGHYSSDCTAGPIDQSRRVEIQRLVNQDLAEREARRGGPKFGKVAPAVVVETQNPRGRYESRWRRDEIPSAASDEWVMEVTDNYGQERQSACREDHVCSVEEVYAARRTRDDAQLDQGGPSTKDT